VPSRSTVPQVLSPEGNLASRPPSAPTVDFCAEHIDVHWTSALAFVGDILEPLDLLRNWENAVRFAKVSRSVTGFGKSAGQFQSSWSGGQWKATYSCLATSEMRTEKTELMVPIAPKPHALPSAQPFKTN
jgi:hypothetical protein